MSLSAKNVPMSGGKFTPAAPLEVGNYPCRVAQIIDMGLQPQDPYENIPKQPENEIMVTYEFTDEFLKDEAGEDIMDKPRFMSETFTLKSHKSEKAKSTLRMKALDPSGALDWDWSLVPNTACVVTTGLTSGGKGKVANVSPMRAKDVANTPELVNPPKVFTLAAPDLTVFMSMPEWVQTKIKENLNFNGSPLQAALAGGVQAPVAPAQAPMADAAPRMEAPVPAQAW